MNSGNINNCEEMFINEETPKPLISLNKEVEWVEEVKKVLIATVYSPDPVLLAATRMSADRLVLFIDQKPDKEQQHSLKIIQESLGRVIDIKIVKTPVYEIYEVAKKAVEVIDLQPKEDIIYINITSGRKTKALGLLYAAYARSNRIRKIAYNPEEDKTSVIYLPKMKFNLTDSQREVLDQIEKADYKTMADLSEKVDISRAMLYRNTKDLEEMGLIETELGIKITDAGRICLL